MDKKTRIYAIISTILFILMYFGIKHFREESNYEKAILGQWRSNETNGENFTFVFLENSMVEITNGNDILKMQYQINRNRLKIIDNKVTNQNYLYKIEKEELILSTEGDSLIFYKVKTD